MKYLKLFEEMKIEENEFPEQGYDLCVREKNILIGLVGQSYLGNFIIKVEDHYYYTKFSRSHHGLRYYTKVGNNRFDGFNKLKDYILSRYYIEYRNFEGYLELLKTSELDPSVDDNYSIRWASLYGKIDIVKILLKDPRVDPSFEYNMSIRWASENGHTEIVKLLLKDPRVRSKLTQEEINKYTKYLNETS